MKAPVFRVFQDSEGVTIICDGSAHKRLEPVQVKGGQMLKFVEHEDCVRNDFRLWLREQASCKNAKLVPPHLVTPQMLEAFGCALVPDKHLVVCTDVEGDENSVKFTCEVLSAGAVVRVGWLKDSSHLAPGKSFECVETVNGPRPFDRRIKIINVDGQAEIVDLDAEKREAFRQFNRDRLITFGVPDFCIKSFFRAATVAKSIKVALWVEKIQREFIRKNQVTNPVPGLLRIINEAIDEENPRSVLSAHGVDKPRNIDLAHALAGAKVILTAGGIRPPEDTAEPRESKDTLCA